MKVRKYTHTAAPSSPPWDKIVPLVVDYSEGRLRQSTIDWIRSRPALDENALLLCAEKDDALAGVACVYPPKRVSCVVVALRYRHQGIGTKLLQQCIAERPDVAFEVGITNKFGLLTCFRAGLHAVGWRLTPQGRMALVFKVEGR